MELWIRSQDKEYLLKAERLYINKSDKSYTIMEELCTLGKYNSKERALEVLDEVQDLLKGIVRDKHINKFDIYNDMHIKVYEMPKE